MPIHYTKLNSVRSEIRLLTLLPGKFEDDVRCSVKVVSLDDRPSFEALSYVWGNTSINQTIQVDGASVPVTVNLFGALRRLRRAEASSHTAADRVLWVDALCINQSNTPEKNIQVPLMQRIYREATSVVIWLGEAPTYVDLMLSFCEYLEDFDKGRRTTASEQWYQVLENGMQHPVVQLSRLRVKRCISLFYELPYWQRMWTYQEFRLPKNEPLCHWGAFAFPASTVLREEANRMSSMAKELEEGYSLSSDSAESEEDNGSGEASSSAVDTTLLSEIESERQDLDDHDFPRERRMYTLDLLTDRENDCSLMDSIFETALRECYSPLDKVFALYGLHPEINAKYPVDYNKSYADVVMQTLQYITDAEAKLPSDEAAYSRSSPGFLVNFKPAALKEKTSSWPSWMPDLRSPVKLSEPCGFRGPVWDMVARPEEPTYVVSSKSRTLRLLARPFGKCERVQKLDQDRVEVLRTLDTYLCEVEAHGASELQERRARLCENIAQMCYVGCGETPGNDQWSIDQFLQGYRRARVAFDNSAEAGSAESDADPARAWNRVNEFAGVICQYTLLFAEDDHYAGICEGSAQVGDVIVIEAAEQCIIVLRKTDAQRESYRMVSAAYVNGLSDNWFAREDCIAELAQREPREYVIV